MSDTYRAMVRATFTALREAIAERRGPFSLALLAGLLMGVSSIGIDLDRGLQNWRDGLHSRTASSKLAFVEIDAKSLAAFQRWPWSRDRYASVIAALQRAGAETIAFDVDFSAPSQPGPDKTLATAIARSNVPIILPTFRQSGASSDQRVFENLPIPSLRANAQLAAVNIYADPDGLVREYPYGVVTAGIPRPSIGAILAGVSGRMGQSFPIDTSIDATTIPRISFVDVATGHVPPDFLRGRNILIGASAIELGDRYPLPGHGVIPGPMIQLLAAETLIHGSAPVNHGFVWPLMIALAALVLISHKRGAERKLVSIPVAGLILLLPLFSEVAKLGTFTIVPALAALITAQIADALRSAMRSVRQARFFDEETALPNARSLQALLDKADGGTAVVLKIVNYADIASVIGKGDAAEFIRRISDRLQHAGDCPIHRLDEDSLGWMTFDNSENQAQQIDAAAAMLRPVFEVAGRRIELNFGFGLAHDDGRDTLTKASIAADRAVVRFLRFVRFSSDMEQESEWRLALAAELDQAMAAGDIWVAYQPKFDMRVGQITAVEALVRWRHPGRGMIPPDAFIPVLEEGVRIADLTIFVLERALSDRAGWHAQGIELGVAVNLSALLPSDRTFVNRLQSVLEEHPKALPYLTLEVTESAAMIDPEAAIRALDAIAALGVSLSIDDYGTGQSTLSYLKRLPAREIKIDKSFVLALEESKSDQVMVRSTIDLAHELGFKVVAEGVETEAALRILAAFNCDTAQGWHIGRPMPAADILALFNQGEVVFA